MTDFRFEEEIDYAVYFRTVVGAILLLWALPIGMDVAGEGPGKGPAEPKPAPTSSGDARELPLPNYPNPHPVLFDRQAFLTAFRRQSQSQLVDCTKPRSPGAVTLRATLDHKGKLHNVVVVHGDAPNCLLPIVASMQFAPLAEGKRAIAQIDVEWRVDF
jgi:hypothetical protein